MTNLLADHTSFHVGGPAKRWVVATTEEQLVEAVDSVDQASEPLLILAGGSNMLVGDAGFPGTVVPIATKGIHAHSSAGELSKPACGGVIVDVAAGEVWDDFVALAVASEWRGLAPLSGIPGSVGATPIQNVGAYGSEVANTISGVSAWDRFERRRRWFPLAECRFSYRDSIFKAQAARLVVLSVQFQFFQGQNSLPIRYAELASRLGIEVGQRAPMTQVREVVLALRASKGMVLDEQDHDTWSAGSFFTNPVVDAEQAATLPADAPRFAQPDGTIKTSAAWLIERAGFTRGYGISERVTLSTKHTLAITNRGGASTDDILVLARQVRDGVEARFGVRLQPEPNLVNCSLD